MYPSLPLRLTCAWLIHLNVLCICASASSDDLVDNIFDVHERRLQTASLTDWYPLWVVKPVFAHFPVLCILHLPYLQRAEKTHQSVSVCVLASKPLCCFRANKHHRVQLLGYRCRRGEIWPCLDIRDYCTNRRDATCQPVLPPWVNRCTESFCKRVLYTVFWICRFCGVQSQTCCRWQTH